MNGSHSRDEFPPNTPDTSLGLWGPELIIMNADGTAVRVMGMEERECDDDKEETWRGERQAKDFD